LKNQKKVSHLITFGMVSLHAFASTELAVLDEPIALLVVGDLELVQLDVICGGHFVLLLLFLMLWRCGDVEMEMECRDGV